MHEVDCLPARPGASGEVVGESAAEGTNVNKVADDVDEHVEDCRGEYLRHDGGLLGVDGDCLPQRGAAQLVRMGLPRTKPQFRAWLSPRTRHGGRELSAQCAGDGLFLKLFVTREPDLDARGGRGNRYRSAGTGWAQILVPAAVVRVWRVRRVAVTPAISRGARRSSPARMPAGAQGRGAGAGQDPFRCWLRRSRRPG